MKRWYWQISSSRDFDAVQSIGTTTWYARTLKPEMAQPTQLVSPNPTTMTVHSQGTMPSSASNCSMRVLLKQSCEFFSTTGSVGSGVSSSTSCEPQVPDRMNGGLPNTVNSGESG